MNLKVAVVAGGARGMGKKIVDELSLSGYVVYVLDVNCYEDKNNNIFFKQANLLKTKNATKAIRDIYDKHDTIDLVVYNARTRGKTEFLDESIESFDDSLGVMLKAPFFIYQTLAKLKAKTKNKKETIIVNISSIAGELICPQSPSYHFAKAGINHLTRYISKNAGKYNIRANAIAPGFIVQDEHLERYYSKENKEYREISQSAHPLGEIGSSEDVTNLVLFLASEKSRFINGQVINLDGASTIQEQLSVRFEQSKINLKPKK